MQFKAAIFDMDGTLVDSLMLWDIFWAEMGRRFRQDDAFRPSAEDDKAVRTLTLKGAMNLIHKNYHVGESGGQLVDMANEIMVDFYTNRVQLKPGVRAFLDALLAQGTKMCIASATVPSLIDMAMKHCELEKYFDKVFSCGEIGKGKDQPDIYLMAQRHLGETIEETWVFEDSLVAIETAKKIGMQTTAIFDRYNFGQEEMRRIATHYIAEGEKLTKLLEGNA